MTVTKLGTLVPRDHDREAEPVLTEFRYFAEPEDEVDATFNVYEGRSGSALIGWYLEAVGLVTWHRADSLEEAEAWVYEQIKPWAHLDEAGETVACTDECDHDGSQAAEQAYQALLFTIIADKEGFIDAVIEGLADVGSQEEWDSESIEILLEPIVTFFRGSGIPSPGQLGEEPTRFWEGVARRHGR